MLVKFFDAVFVFQRALCSLFICAIVLLIASEVVLRTAFSVTLGFAHEVSNYLLVASAFIGFSVAFADGKLFRVDLVNSLLPERAQLYFQYLFDAISLLFSAIIFYYLLELVLSSYRTDVHSATSLGVPLYVPQLAMPVGIALLIFSLVARMYFRAVKQKRV